MNKDIILSNVSPNQIFSHFLNLSDIPKGNISSPFSKDENPSFRVYPNGSFKCFSSGKQGDVFQFVADLNQLDCKDQFEKVLNIIADEMNLSSQSKGLNPHCTPRNKTNKTPNNQDRINGNDGSGILAKELQHTQQPSLQQTPFKIDVINSDWNIAELEYWKNLRVSIELLNQYHINPVKQFSFFSSTKNKKIKITVTDFLAFGYEVNGNYEVYIPDQPEKNKTKFFCNGLTKDDIFGFSQLENKKIENLIICAGKKDAIVAVANGFNAVAFRSENHLPDKSQIEQLQQLCNTLLICYDNDKGGISGRKSITDKFPSIVPLQLPMKINDLTDFFQLHESEELQIIIDETLLETTTEYDSDELTTVFHVTESYLNKHYDLRYNMISLDIEISEKDKAEFSSCNENSLWLELQKKSIKISINALVAILKSDFIPTYNPITSYFDNLPKWKGEIDYITKYSQYVRLSATENKEQFEYHFKKWCVRAVKCASIPNYFNKQAFIITDDGLGQNIGKSSWCRFLCPSELSNYLGEDLKDDKDSLILLCKNFLINLDELDALSRKEVNHLKSYFSKAQINERLPYDRKNSIIQRVASFIGSTNMTTFLHDETGSVRWLCFVVTGIDWNYKNNFNVDNLWAQAVALANDPRYDETMTVEDIAENERRNDKFQIVSPERDMIHKFFDKSTDLDTGEFMTSTEILNYINLHISSGIRMSSVGIGKALKALRYKRQKNEGVYGYWVIKRPE